MPRHILEAQVPQSQGHEAVIPAGSAICLWAIRARFCQRCDRQALSLRFAFLT